MFDYRGLGHVDRKLADVRHVVGDAFEVLGDEEQARGARRGRGLARHQLDEVAEEPLVHHVDLVVALDLNDEPRLQHYPQLSRMADVAASMLRAALDAFTQGDATAARRIIEQDDEIDVMYEGLFRDLIELMTGEPTATPRAARLLFVAKHLERIADYVTDICELTVYMTEAAVIKHSY